MIILSLCILAFLAAFLIGRFSLVDGVGVVMSVGYAFGIARANFLDTMSYFLFDAAVAGLYLAAIGELLKPQMLARFKSLRIWLMLLIGWPIIMLFIPIQDYMIQVVGFRGNVYLLPIIALGAMFDDAKIARLAQWLAILNLGAFAMACVEYQLGIERFFPKSAVTEIMYKSRDLAGYTAYRIPSTFSSAHAYGGTMAHTLPWLLVAWMRPRIPVLEKGLLTAGVVASVLGVLMSSTRVSAGLMFAVLITFCCSPEVHGWFRLIWVGIFGSILYIASSEERLHRFTQLADFDVVADRVYGSVNLNFFELLAQYPMGNGLGGGGTSIPAFLRDRFRNPVGMENEYSRIMLEQSVIGLFIWGAFLIWLLTRFLGSGMATRSLTARLFAATVFCDLLLASIGTGMLTAIPSTALMMLHIGYVGRDAKQWAVGSGQWAEKKVENRT